jgi:DNA-binding response OmpR family regulator
MAGSNGRRRIQAGTPRSAPRIDWSRATISSARTCVSLSRVELRLLSVLIAGNGGPVTREYLINEIWPPNGVSSVGREQRLRVYIHGLRKRLSAIGFGQSLTTIRRVGYRLVWP